MKIGLTAAGKYTITEGTDILCQCSTLTEASAVQLYLSMKPVSALEKGIARTAILNYDNEVKAMKEQRAAKKARQKAKKLSQTEKTTADPEETEIEVPILPEI